MTTIRKIEETIYKNALKFDDADIEILNYYQYSTTYNLICMVNTLRQANNLTNKLNDYLTKTKLDEFFEADTVTMNSDYDNAPATCIFFKNALYSNQISAIIRVCCDILGIPCQEKIMQGSLLMHTHKDFNGDSIIKDDLCFVEDYDLEEDCCRVKYLNGGVVSSLYNNGNLKFYNKKRKFNLPEGICWDTRNTVLNNKAWFNVVLLKNGKQTSTKTKNIKDGMNIIAKNRVEEKLWTEEQAKKYLSEYNQNIECGWTVELAKYFAKEGPREHKTDSVKTCDINETVTTVSNINTKNKRMYDLPKHVCYDKAESRNRERNIFQTSLRVNGKILKNNLYTVKDAVIDVASKMLEHTDIWSLDDIGNYLKTYRSEMENGNFVPSNTPKSPCWRKREKKKNIEIVKQELTTRLEGLLKFAKDHDIDININVN